MRSGPAQPLFRLPRRFLQPPQLFLAGSLDQVAKQSRASFPQLAWRFHVRRRRLRPVRDRKIFPRSEIADTVIAETQRFKIIESRIEAADEEEIPQRAEWRANQLHNRRSNFANVSCT